MNDMEQNSLAKKMLRILRVWMSNIIPEETKGCIRSKTAVITKVYGNNTYDVVLPEDVDRLNEIKEQLQNNEINNDEYDKEYEKITLNNLSVIKTDSYNIDDFVIIGYLDNRLTNAFILCKNIMK